MGKTISLPARRMTVNTVNITKNGIPPLLNEAVPKKSKQLLKFERTLEACLVQTFTEFGLHNNSKKIDMLTKKVDQFSLMQTA